ncbi:hypothetical protein J4H92_01290 [Leucobacter weissii]|uniref:Glycosyltransferase subfamily 4-like N-terminal domain-containing protein n=1 Tax=Leucobacter weissii TaxID=1983706 RepID=A0A939SAL1_9MICO|nr:hypothetical protein [Leucobacter weissii]
MSLTPLRRDARVLRQIALLASLGEVTTIGFGETPEGAAHHLRVPDGLATLPQTPAGVARLALRAHRSAECSSPAARWVLRQRVPRDGLRAEGLEADGRGAGARPDGEPWVGEHWDLVVANDARVLDLAFRLAGDAPVWADLHEWAPEERTHIRSWRLLVAPFMVHLCARYLPRAPLVTTVSEGIVELYRERFGVDARLMTNAGPFRGIAVGPAPGNGGPAPRVEDSPVRCVHSGAAIHGRGLERMIAAFLRLPERFTLDLFLVPGGDGGAHLRELRSLAAGSPRIAFRDPVAPAELPDALAAYDLGVFWIPPTHTNARLTLPNKFFDYVQARLGLAIGPSEEMVRVLERYGLGVVSDSFEVEDLVASLRDVTAAQLDGWKRAADRAAEPLGFEAQAAPIRAALGQLLRPA